ncbi:MAG: hypothetical protein AAF211_14110 [Myxococcota bacterium]
MQAPLHPVHAVDAAIRRLREEAVPVDVVCGDLFRLLTGHPSRGLERAGSDSPRWDAVPEPLRALLQQGSSVDPAARPTPSALARALEATREVLRELPDPVDDPEVDAVAMVATVPPTPRPAAERAPTDRSLLWVGVALIALVSGLGLGLGPGLGAWISANGWPGP